MDEELGIIAAADFLNLSRRQLQRWDESGVFPAKHRPNGRRYYQMSTLVEMQYLLSTGVSRKDTAAQLGVDQKTLWRWDQRKDGYLYLKSSYQIGGTTYYTQHDIDEFIARKKRLDELEGTADDGLTTLS